MPLYKTITVNPSTRVLIWKVEESYETLISKIELTSYCQTRLKSIKGEPQRKQFLSIRLLLKEMGYSDGDMYYDQMGKPHLKDDNFISVTHSHHFSGIIVSSAPVGIDVEKQREKIVKIAPKFTPLQCYKTGTDKRALIKKLTAVWGAKEAVYKIINSKGLSFLKHIHISQFNSDDQNLLVEVIDQGKALNFTVKFFEFEKFTCVYALSSEPGLEP